MERRHLSGEIRALVSSELERRGFLAAFTERTGGVSSSAFSSLNLGPETGDDPELVLRNHELLIVALGIEQPYLARQVHGDGLVEVPLAAPRRHVGEADGLITSAAGVPLAVMVADCVPLALASERDGTLEVAHVGWRGLSAGIVQRAARRFPRPVEVVAAIGPAIGPCHYEVGPEVVESVRRGTGGLARLEGSRLDLAGTVEAVLREEGVGDVDRAGVCTADEPTRFFSHRRDGRTGRQALVAVRL